MSELDQILKPIAGSNPCGQDLEYDSRFQAVKDLVEAGNEENPTNWNKVKKQCMELLNDGRSTDILVLLVVSMVAVDGYQGLRDGLQVLTKSIEDFWDTIYPELDMEEPEPDRHEIRLNSIAQLGEKPRKLGDKLSFVEKVLRAPLSLKNSRLNVCFWPVWESSVTGASDSSELSSALSHIGQLPYDDRLSLCECIKQSIDCIEQFNNFLMDKTGSAYNAPFDEHLVPILKQIHNNLNKNQQTSASDGEEAIGAENPNASVVAAPPPPPPGTINSRADVKEALGKIVDYYRENEPGSPVPYLAIRAQQLVDSDFMEIIKNLSKETEQQFKKALNVT